MKVERGSLLLVRSNQERVSSRKDQFQRLGIGGGDQGVDTREAVIVSVTGTRQRGRTLGRLSPLASGAKKPDAMLSLLSMLIGPMEKPEVVCKSVTVELTLEETAENMLGSAQGREELAEERSL